MTDLERLQALVREATQLLARHDGIHDMHGAASSLETWRYIAERNPLDNSDWAYVDALISFMRFVDACGRKPTQLEESRIRRRIERELGFKFPPRRGC